MHRIDRLIGDPPALEVVAEGVGPLRHLLEDLADDALLRLLPDLQRQGGLSRVSVN